MTWRILRSINLPIRNSLHNLRLKSQGRNTACFNGCRPYLRLFQYGLLYEGCSFLYEAFCMSLGYFLKFHVLEGCAPAQLEGGAICRGVNKQKDAGASEVFMEDGAAWSFFLLCINSWLLWTGAWHALSLSVPCGLRPREARPSLHGLRVPQAWANTDLPSSKTDLVPLFLQVRKSPYSKSYEVNYLVFMM